MSQINGSGGNTSWEKVNKWYKGIIGGKGLYFHEHVILPKSLSLLRLDDNSSVLDLACGEGIFERYLPGNISYLGIDNSPSFIKSASVKKSSERHKFMVADITRPLINVHGKFSHAVIILAIQNLKYPYLAIRNASHLLCPAGKLLIVLNHPCFRIPRLTSWETDTANKIQFRRINRYMTPQSIPISVHPSKGKISPRLWSFHYPLSSYSDFLHQNGFFIVKMEEWTSDKKSVGKASRMENLARSEIPLFLAVLAEKI